MTIIQTFLGDIVAKKRHAVGWTQQELANKCRVHITTIEKLENYETWPRHHTLLMLNSALDIPEIVEYFKKRHQHADKAYLAEFLIGLRRKGEMTLIEMSLRSGLPTSYIARFEDCKSACKEKHITLLAAVFNMKAAEFIERAKAQYLENVTPVQLDYA